MATSSKGSASHETLEQVVGAILIARRWNQLTLAARLGISSKTLARYCSGHPPTPARARDMVQQLTFVEPALHARFAACLAVPVQPAQVASPVVASAPKDPSNAKLTIDLAILAASEQLGLVPTTARTAARMVLDAMMSAGLEPAVVRDLLMVKAKGAS